MPVSSPSTKACATSTYSETTTRAGEVEIVDVLRRGEDDKADERIEDRSWNEDLRSDGTAACQHCLQYFADADRAEDELPDFAFLPPFADAPGIFAELFVERNNLGLDHFAQAFVEARVDLGLLHFILFEPLDEIIVDDPGKPFFGDESFLGMADDLFRDLVQLELAHRYRAISVLT